MPDKDTIELIIGNKVITDFESYRIESDLFAAADAFSVVPSNPDIQVDEGARCQLRVNGKLELNGIIDRIVERVDKSGTHISLEGRDLMGLICDSYCSTFPNLVDVSLKQLAGQLLAGIPFINRKSIIYGKGDRSRAVELTKKDDDPKYTQVKPSQTVFDVLREKAMSLGMIFMALPDGTLMFAEPAASGKAQFFLTRLKSGAGNNIEIGSLTRDISKRYKTITVVGQQQGDDDIEPAAINTPATVLTDPAFPFAKNYTAQVQYDGQNPMNYARVLMSSQQFEGWQYEAVVPGHSQFGKNFQINAIVHVRDELLRLNEDLLCYGRIFEMSKDAGSTTTLKLSKLGVLPE